MSTGMINLAEIHEAVTAIRDEGNDQIALLKCTSSYPAPAEEANLDTIPHLAQAFDVVTGLSDHTMGSTAPVVAVTLGARIIEKHFTLSRNDPGPDSSFSMEPHEFRQMVDAIRMTEKAIGTSTLWGNRKRENQQGLSAFPLCRCRYESGRDIYRRIMYGQFAQPTDSIHATMTMCLAKPPHRI